MLSVVDKAILAGLGVEAVAFILLLAMGRWRKRFGKVAIIVLGLAILATLAPVARLANAYWRLHTVEGFARTCITQLNAGEMPPLSENCTEPVKAGLERLKKSGLPAEFEVESVEFASDYYALNLSTDSGQRFWCMIQATVPSMFLFAPSEYRLLDISPPEDTPAPGQSSEDSDVDG